MDILKENEEDIYGYDGINFIIFIMGKIYLIFMF